MVFLPYRPRSTRSLRVSLVAALLLLAGDIEANPGPVAEQPIDLIRIGCLNCFSAVNKTALIHDLITDCNRKLDVLMLSETFFNTDTPTSQLDDLAPPGFAALHVPRPLVPGGRTRGGGLAVVFRQAVVVRRHPLADNFHPTTCELQLVRVGLSPLTHTVLHVYRPQWMSTANRSSAATSERVDRGRYGRKTIHA